MATRTGTTAVAIATSLRTTYTTPLLAAIRSGSVVTAAHINSIRQFINDTASHTHTLAEFTSIGEFGNTQNTVSNNRTTSVPNYSSTSLTVATGNTITAAHHNTLRTGVNLARVHTHTFTDDVP